MKSDDAELDSLRAAYKAAVEEWIGAIRKKEALASGNSKRPQMTNSA